MDKHYHHLHIARHTHFRQFLHDKYNDLVIADTLRHMALAMISLFIPIFLYKTGFTIIEIALLELARCFLSGGMHYFAVSHIPKWGVKKTLVISYVLNILLYLLLYQATFLLTKIDWFVYLGVIALFNVAATTIYWTGHHVYFFNISTAADSGKKVGLIFSIPTLAGIISPFLGGVLISQFGFKIMFLVSAALLAVAGGSLFFSKNIEVEKSNLNLKKILDTKEMGKNIIFFIQGAGFHATSFFWPLLLFLSSVKLTSIGLLYLFSNLAYSIIGYFSGKFTDRRGNRKIVTIGSLGYGCSIIFRALATTITTMTFWQTMGGTFGSLLHIPLEAGFYKFTSRHDYYNAIMNRELYMYLGRIFIVFVFFILLTQISVIKAMIGTLIFSGLCTFLLSLMAKNNRSIIS